VGAGGAARVAKWGLLAARVCAYMPPMPTRRPRDRTRTTLDLSTPLWQAAKVRAIREHLRDVVVNALAAYVKTLAKDGTR